MAKNKISDLRDHLFATIEALKDEEKPMDVARARAICEVSQAIIDTAKVEIDLVRAVGGEPGSGFFLHQEESRDLPQIGTRAAPRQLAEARKASA